MRRRLFVQAAIVGYLVLMASRVAMAQTELPTDITLEALLTAAGAIIAGGIVTALVELVKMGLGQAQNGALWAFVLSGILYLVVAANVFFGNGTGDTSAFNAGFNIFLAWLSCATSAVGIHATQRTVSRGGI